jgi:hypothetical protein
MWKHVLIAGNEWIEYWDPPQAPRMKGGFAPDSPLEGSGFELSVPLGRATTSELSVPLEVNALGARLPRKRPGVSAVGLASRSSIMLPSPRALRGAELFGSSDRVQRCPALHNNAQTDQVSVAQLY